MPCLAEVIGIDNAVTVGSCTHGCIETVILVFLYNAALEHLTAAHKCRLDWVTGVEKAVDILGHIDWFFPSLAIVLAEDGGNEVGILTCGVAVAIHGTAGNCNDEHLVACAVGNNGRVTKGGIEIVHGCRCAACTHSNVNHVAPCLAMVVACAANDIDLSVTGVGTADKTCRSCYQTAVACC